MRQDLQVIPLTPVRLRPVSATAPKVYQITFRCRDRFKAQEVLGRIIDDLETPPGAVFEVHSTGTLPPCPLEFSTRPASRSGPSAPIASPSSWPERYSVWWPASLGNAAACVPLRQGNR